MPICAPGIPGISKPRHSAAGVVDLDFDLLVVEFAVAQFLAEAFLGGGAGIGTHQRLQHALLGLQCALARTSLRLLFARQRDGDFDEVAHDLLDVAADIADLGEFRRLHLEERRAGELGQPARNLRLADAGRADHQDILRQHLLAQPLVELQPAPAVAQRDRDRALGVGLADDEAVELGDDFARGEVADGSVYQAPAGSTAEGQAFRNGDVAVGVNADVGGDVERAAHDRLGVERPVGMSARAAASA